MYNFSTQSRMNLLSCHPDLPTLFNTVLKTVDCTVIEGHRNQEDQEKAFAAGNSKLHYPDGKHNGLPSMAVDVSPYPVDWKDLRRFYFFSGYVLGVADQLKSQGKIQFSVRWGGDWNRNYDITDEKGLKDLVHFELVQGRK